MSFYPFFLMHQFRSEIFIIVNIGIKVIAQLHVRLGKEKVIDLYTFYIST